MLSLHDSALSYVPRAIVVVVLLRTLFFIATRAYRASTNLPLPPGPPRTSLFGNTWPALYGYRTFEEWTKEYGPVFSLRQGMTTIVVVGRVQAAIEIMEKDSLRTADRPVSIAAGDTLSGGMRLLMIRFGDRFKKLRRALHPYLQQKNAPAYRPALAKSVRRHILSLVDDPTRHQDHAKTYAASVVMQIAYGKYPETFDDPDIQGVNHCLNRLGGHLRPGSWKVDVLPMLRFVPHYLTELRQGHKEELELFLRQMQHVRDQMARGEEVPESFGKYVIEKQNELGLNDNEAAYLAGSMFGAGSDTTASAISIAVMAAACHIDKQKAVQDELDSVIGRARPPKLADLERLPKLMAFILETFRWRPVSAGGFPHRATKDIIWGNYRIPAGATVIGNAWAVARDPEYFPDPETFDPSKWLTPEGKLRDDLKSFPFGYGRRVCPGQYIATSSVFVNTALIFWAFNLTQDPAFPIDTLAFTPSANAHPLPFRVTFKHRLARGAEAVREAMVDYEI